MRELAAGFVCALITASTLPFLSKLLLSFVQGML
jgi:hypothetical protein